MSSDPDPQELILSALDGAQVGFGVYRFVPGDRTFEWRLVDAHSARSSGPSPATAGTVASTLDAARAAGGRIESDHRVELPDGTLTWRRLVAYPLGPDLVAAVSYDIAELIEARTQINALSERSSDIVAISGLDDGVAWVSTAAEAILGHPVASIVGRCAVDLVHPDDVDRVVALFAEVVIDPSVRPTVELRLVCADGDFRWFHCSIANRLADPEVGGLVLSLHDIDARRRSEDALRLSELRMRSILENAADAIITTDDDGTIIEFNRAAERIFGVSSADVIGTVYRDLVAGSLAGRAHGEKANGEKANGEKANAVAGSGQSLDIVTARADGAEFDARVSVSKTTIDGRTFTTAILRDVTQEKETARALERRGLYDELTGLASRKLLLDRLEEAIRRAKRRRSVVGLLLLDLDRFKNVNDSLGHDLGDALLVEVAGRLRSAAGEGNTVARLGGDEFVVLCDEARDIDDISDRASCLDEVLRAPFVLGDEEVMLTASIGIAVCSGGAERADELLRHADAAMYRAKDRGRGRVELFDERMQVVVSARLDLESALRRAIERDELVAHYQPIVAFSSGRATHLEALVRWQRPDVELVAPDKFIGIAEETGLIHPIGEWMLQRAAFDCARWQEIAPGVGVSVNVSPRQFDSPSVVEAVARALRDSGLAPQLLGLEITESVLVDDPDETVLLLEELKALGVRIALDDFGTGYSSLTYLQQLPIDELKIDRAFVAALEDERSDLVLLRMMVQLGRAFDLKVVAEGIDTDRKLLRIQRLGCKFGQGYLFARPAPIEQVMARFADGSAPVTPASTRF